MGDQGSRGVTYLELIAVTDHPGDPRLGDPAPGPGSRTPAAGAGAAAGLREMREAIDRYKQAVDQGQIGGTDVKLGSEGYPPDLEIAREGGEPGGAPSTASSSSCAGSRRTP